MNVKQISVFLDNKPGCVAEMINVLDKHNTYIRALTVVDTSEFSMVRLIVDNALWTVNILKEAGFKAYFTDVLATEIPNTPRAFGYILDVLKNAGVNIEYMYAIMGSKSVSNVCMIWKVNSNEAAIDALNKAGIRILGQGDIPNL